ncbi:ATP-binding protein [Proteiniborus sp. MB09-C3]|uniref:ATP-binding protein n=1 Tax=Proteiniborus sp. MB09-C3 TaxID=3050072 RepID=UPI0025539EAF|nr:ATP-binding protein [Proteiniborus sp. MB09-C3]WIV10573.1 ATP-binding protein [Proteiniborus sp. MB09-C3]
MKELSLHVLDLAENSIRAKAKLVTISITEDLNHNLLKILIEDNGNGMDEELLSVADDPFTTTRKTRNVGLGLSLLKAAALRAEGDFHITSEKGTGTKIEATFKHNHIDRAPIGNMGSTIATILIRKEKIDILYIHQVNGRQFIFSTKEIKKLLGEVSINTPEVILWIKDYINENVSELNK